MVSADAFSSFRQACIEATRRAGYARNMKTLAFWLDCDSGPEFTTICRAASYLVSGRADRHSKPHGSRELDAQKERCGAGAMSYAPGGQPTPLAWCMSRATPRTRGSAKRGATICMPTGSWSRVKAAGAVAAGKPTSVIR
jgi:hypothetical protein